MPSKHFVCLTIGSRGDVQPYIALGKALQKEGHRVTIVTHEEYKKWVTGFGITHRTAGGDPGALMKLSVENKVHSSPIHHCDATDTGCQDVLAPIFQREFIERGCPRVHNDYLLTNFLSSVPGSTTVRCVVSLYLGMKSLIRLTVLVDSWEQCKDADVLLESPSAMAGVHIAEALRKLIHYVMLEST
jgi:sterol 3beta-glucosyltransferase